MKIVSDCLCKDAQVNTLAAQMAATDYMGEAHGAATALVMRHGKNAALDLINDRIASCTQHAHQDGRNMLLSDRPVVAPIS